MKRFVLILGIFLILSYDVAAESQKIEDIKQSFVLCSELFEQEKEKCPDSWSMKCYNHLMNTHKHTQECYKKIALNLFENYYGLTKDEAKNKFDNFSRFIYEQYLYIFAETDYCKKNNCGMSLYLYSENTTTEEIHNYVSKIIGSVSARN